MSTNLATHPTDLRRSLYAALGGTFFLRFGNGTMGILTSLLLRAKADEMSAISPTHPYIISATLAGLLIASLYITELGGSFISGGLIDKHGPRRYMVIGPIFGAIAMIVTRLLHLEPNSTTFQFVLFLVLVLVARLLEGTAAATANPATLAYIAVYTSDDAKLRSRISGFFEIATLVGATGGFILGGSLWVRFGQDAFLLNMGAYILSALIFMSVHSVATKSGEHAESHDLKQYAKLVRSPRLRELIPAWLAVSAILGVLFNQSTFQLADPSKGVRAVGEFGGHAVKFVNQTLSQSLDGTQVGIAFGLYGVAFGIGIAIWTVLIPRMRKSTAMLISGAGIVAASIIIALINHTGPIDQPSTLRVILIPLMLIAVMIESGFTPAALVYLSDISELHPENRGMVMGLYSFLLGFGQLGGTIIAGPFADWQGVDGLLLFMAILAILSMASVLLLRKDEEFMHQGLKPSVDTTH
jgi:MFS family permease